MSKKAQPKNGVKDQPKQKQIIEVKMIKHTFTQDELIDLGMQLARSHTTLAEIDSEFELVKSNFKSRTSEQEAIIGRVSSSRLAGYEMRNARCRVTFRPKDRMKDYRLEFDDDDAPPVLTEPMTDADMQVALLPEDGTKFEAKEEIVLWTSAQDGPCSITVGRLSPELLGRKTAMWFAAISVRVGDQNLSESLDNNQPCATKRIDIIQRAAKRLKAWLVASLGKEAAEGFEADIDKAVEVHKEREE